ncbi:MAG TPA: cbb3-type cytochrome c oxidase N-terminal domain-containing protein [Chitinophagaceae bacterium]|nr:cbb3-type cytochrome c oxidase N-terminal domain-containing protein [Chitinophagaceae bacterium]
MSKHFISRFFFIAGALILFNVPANAKGVTGLSGGMEYFLYGVIAFVLTAFTLTIYLLTLKNKYQKIVDLKSGRMHRQSGLRKWWRELDKKVFTKAAPIEREADVLLDHDYDGIKELDNALPPWWKWGFYFTIIVAVIYMFRFHVIKTGPTPLEEYDNEMKVAAAKMEEFRKNNKEAFDEKTVTLADEKGVAEGKKIFSGTCLPCHGGNGEGNAVGPNLTDKYWLHGGSLGDIFKTITNGVPDKGMQAWGKTFSPADIRNISSFILSLQGSKPANAKAPQGNLYAPTTPADTSVRKDTAVKKESIQTRAAK